MVSKKNWKMGKRGGIIYNSILSLSIKKKTTLNSIFCSNNNNNNNNMVMFKNKTWKQLNFQTEIINKIKMKTIYN